LSSWPGHPFFGKSSAFPAVPSVFSLLCYGRLAILLFLAFFSIRFSHSPLKNAFPKIFPFDLVPFGVSLCTQSPTRVLLRFAVRLVPTFFPISPFFFPRHILRCLFPSSSRYGIFVASRICAVFFTPRSEIFPLLFFQSKLDNVIFSKILTSGTEMVFQPTRQSF